MVGHKRKPKQKQQPKNGKNPPAKRQRQQSIVEQSEPLEITDLNDDCLENIFERLSLEDLLNVADANKFLRVAAGSVFQRKFGQEYVEFRELRDKGYFSRYNNLHSSGLKNCLRFVRCFGPHISILHIDYKNSSRKDNSFLDRYVNKFCSKTLTEIQYQHKSAVLMDILEKPFKNVKTLNIWDSSLGNRLGEILTYFPNMQCLALRRNRIEGTSIQDKIPTLNRLIVDINSSKKHRIGHENIVEAVHLNPQLRSLSIHTWYNGRYSFTDLLEIASQNSSITSLEMCHDQHDDIINSLVELILKLASALPMLERLEFSYILQPKTVLEFITCTKHLTFFHFIISEPYEQNFVELKTLLNDEWNSEKYMTFSRLHVILKRST